MRPQAFQPGEMRDENDEVIRAGSYGKNTPFVNATNTGILDYVINNFDVVQGEIEYLEEQEGRDLSNYYTKPEVDALIPTRVGQLTNDAGFVTATATVNGATHDGAGNDITTTYAPINNPVLTGQPKAPTPATTDNSTRLATTEFVQAIASSVVDGVDGGYYIPQIDNNSNITWVASKSTMPEIQTSVNIKGDTGATGSKGATGGYYIPSVDEDGMLSWIPSAEYMPSIEESYIRGATGATGEAGADGQDGADGGYYIPVITNDVLTFDKSKDSMPDSLISVNVKGDTGADGNGIEDIEMNEDYTLTFTFTDGDTYTTASIRGEKGEKGDTVSVDTLTLAEVDDIWDDN